MILKHFKQRVRTSLQSWLHRNGCTVVVASTGRAGSTLLYKSILDGYVKSRWGRFGEKIAGTLLRKVHGGFVARLDTIVASAPAVLKTHDIYPGHGLHGAKCIFVYGDPLDSARSVEAVVQEKGQEWFRQHQYHLRASGDYSELFEIDALNYAGQIRSWLSRKDENVMAIPYEEIWSRLPELEKFVGFKISLPRRRERAEKQAPQAVNKKLFGDLRCLMHDYENWRYGA